MRLPSKYLLSNGRYASMKNAVAAAIMNVSVLPFIFSLETAYLSLSEHIV